ncbi:hypothetical protein MiTe_02341 [Microcystis aeruginosa NIES-2520]|jgi:hypothetical protein|uniref:Uncharacterized protein n=2 Tax=Microcystis aeruginosa TaxID=1126 RepID=A0A5A5RQP2_MICAE|nr:MULTISPECIES: hypothetical protein [unclassified Microcystis]MCZ8365530.1 hypothetical protein [Microcystis sp. LE19-251.1A]MDJ0538274.1 hypothetical protein [Microcystis sp. M53603_WE2]MDJ0564807.1 hypothetical protein [Microcystis sp. M49629_WE12]CCH96540.1 hypothetical protein MICAB_2210015 [Microcystis aeruginosa PCC 9717]GCA75507.1 hypothetical protein MiTe_02341 [Microcystis aeruginosa NIES-2520]
MPLLLNLTQTENLRVMSHRQQEAAQRLKSAAVKEPEFSSSSS